MIEFAPLINGVTIAPVVVTNAIKSALTLPVASPECKRRMSGASVNSGCRPTKRLYSSPMLSKLLVKIQHQLDRSLIVDFYGKNRIFEGDRNCL